MAVTKQWKIQQVDINNAFLKGNLKETVYIKQPEGFIDASKPGYVCKLNKALYGLKQASKAWYDTLKGFLLQFGFIHSAADHCLFHGMFHNKQILLLVYVDDILITGEDPHLIQQLITKLHDKFFLKHLGEVSYFLGLEAQVTPEFIKLSQSKYITDILVRTNLLDCKACPTPSCPSQKLSHHDSPSFSKGLLGRV